MASTGVTLGVGSGLLVTTSVDGVMKEFGD